MGARRRGDACAALRATLLIAGTAAGLRLIAVAAAFGGLRGHDEVILATTPLLVGRFVALPLYAEPSLPLESSAAAELGRVLRILLGRARAAHRLRAVVSALVPAPGVVDASAIGNEGLSFVLSHGRGSPCRRECV